MSLPLASVVGPSAYWYVTRATGTVALILLTLAVVLGVIDVQQFSTTRVPRFVVDGLHRTASLLAVMFVLVHILTSALDSFASIPLIDAIVPFAGTYRPFWVGLGAVSSDLLLAILITSLARRRIGYRAWRFTHWLAYASWPIALLHGLGTGSDIKSTWMLPLTGGCVIVVLIAVWSRVVSGWPEPIRPRTAALALSVLFAGGVAMWLPGGPLGAHWARRSGTPPSLLRSSSGSRRPR
jgi:methionine sulfoxide reductase heme-binding subunit